MIFKQKNQYSVFIGALASLMEKERNLDNSSCLFLLFKLAFQSKECLSLGPQLKHVWCIENV